MIKNIWFFLTVEERALLDVCRDGRGEEQRTDVVVRPPDFVPEHTIHRRDNLHWHVDDPFTDEKANVLRRC